MSDDVELRLLVDLRDDNAYDIAKLEELTRKKLPQNTCPKIDKVIKAISNIEKIISHPNKYETTESIASDVENELWGLEAILEELRSNNDSLRNLSHDWRDCAENNHERLNTLVDAHFHEALEATP